MLIFSKALGRTQNLKKKKKATNNPLKSCWCKGVNSPHLHSFLRSFEKGTNVMLSGHGKQQWHDEDKQLEYEMPNMKCWNMKNICVSRKTFSNTEMFSI